MDKNPHTTATSYVYYINEATEADAWVQDQFGASRPWIRQWQTAWSQTVLGCPVEYKIMITLPDSDGALQDVDTAQAVYGSDYYSQVIYYSNTQA